MGFLNILEVSRKQYYIFKSNKTEGKYQELLK